MHWRGSWRMLNWNWRRARRKSEYWDPSSWRGKRPDLLFEESFNSLFWFSRVCFQTSLSTWSLWHALFSLLSRHFSYYKILGIPKDASSAEIKKAFRSQSLIHHPDKGGDEEKFKLVNEAFGILSDDDKRRRFDAGQDDLESDSPFGGGMGGGFGGEEGEFWGEGWWKLRCRKVGEESNQDGWENLEPLIVAFTDPLFLPVLISLLLSLLHLFFITVNLADLFGAGGGGFSGFGGMGGSSFGGAGGEFCPHFLQWHFTFSVPENLEGQSLVLTLVLTSVSLFSIFHSSPPPLLAFFPLICCSQYRSVRWWRIKKRRPTSRIQVRLRTRISNKSKHLQINERYHFPDGIISIPPSLVSFPSSPSHRSIFCFSFLLNSIFSLLHSLFSHLLLFSSTSTF